ncbi:VENN motif pre-toxin domain-containing protein [Pantoea sp. Z09]|uniref:VENN motif pre-toxin domain-containing protein n=1 Tax=Pantoea sp. Z09 TaxID=2886821 RepID=UPI001EFC41BF|nr:VENN motif pre-toxin domain-containing protein [Pantoea sp. Z09]
MIAEIGVQVADIARTQGEIAGLKAQANPEALAAAREALRAKGTLNPTADEIAKQAFDTAMKPFGTGSSLQQGLQAATAAIQGIAGGSVAQAVAGGAAPYIAGLIGSSGLDDAGKVMAHAAVNAALAAAQGSNALVGAAGAATAEMAGMIALEVYGKSATELSETEKQTVSALATLAAGLAGGLTGGRSADAVAGAQAGKTTVENNALSVQQNQERAKEMTQCQGDACSAVIEKYKKINAEQHESVVNCSGTQACVDKANEVGRLQADYANRTNELLEKARTHGGLSPEEQNELSILQVTTIQLEADRTAAIHNALASGDSEEAKQLAINSLAQAVGTSAAGIAAGVGKGGKGSPLPTAQPTVTANGLIYKSNPKHTLGQPSNRPNAGIEPQDSLKLFEQSIPSTKQYPNKEVRFAVDSQGNIHRFVGTNGEYHWNGSTADKNALTSDQIPTAIQKQLGVRVK